MLLGNVDLSYTDNLDTGVSDGKFAEIGFGVGYRPVSDDRLNMLAKYTYLYDLDSVGQEDADPDERSHIFAIEGSYDIDQNWAVGGKLAWKGHPESLTAATVRDVIDRRPVSRRARSCQRREAGVS